MAYRALEKMRDINRDSYGVGSSVRIPDLAHTARTYGREALLFLRESCENLAFDTNDSRRASLADSDGRSASPHTIPYNMERDLDRLSFELAVSRFLASGTREDAFDVYYCYCEIFRPFGSGYDSSTILLQLLAEHEANASSLLMKHRDHYSHSVYVFLIGLAIYRNHEVIQNAYNKRYGLVGGPRAAQHFLKYWGLTSLFHDVGYPFEIAHQQMKAYVCTLFPNNNDDWGFAPYVSYRHMDEFTISRIGDLNKLYARAITDRLDERYLARARRESYYLHHKLLGALRDRAIHKNPAELDYLFMDHAYFSGMVLIKTYLQRHPEIGSYKDLPEVLMDSFVAIILHNSLFKFTIRSLLHTSEPLSLNDGQPLSYLLMLCDELQCWDRASYGQNSRGGIYPCDFDLSFEDGGMKWTYVYDEAYESQTYGSPSYRNMLTDGYTKRSGAKRAGRSKFVDDIDEIVRLADVLPGFESDVNKPDTSDTIHVAFENKQKKTGVYLSESSYLNLYDFALALNGRYCGAKTPDEMRRAFEEDLSLEYKLSNIAQAKGYDSRLADIGCFYTDRPVDYEPVTDFSDEELVALAKSEHDRWCAEKRAIGWSYGDGHVGRIGDGRNDNAMRERTRLHHDLVDFGGLDEEEIAKDREPMRLLLDLIREFNGLTIYRV